MIEIGVCPRSGESVLSRRAFLRTSLIGAGAFGVPHLVHGAGKARNDTAVIQIWLGGGPSHMDMYDLKPALPAEYRGPYRPIATNVPGTQVCDLLPLQSQMMDRVALIRSLRHTTNEHAQGIYWSQTGYWQPVNDNSSETHHPSIGSVVARVRGPNRPGMVPYVYVGPDAGNIPFYLKMHQGAHLGARYAPMFIENARTRRTEKEIQLEDLITKVRFHLPSVQLLPDLDVARLSDRVGLRQRFDEMNRQLERSRSMTDADQYQQRAFELVTNEAARNAFDLSREDPRLRERYGMNAWGQGLLLCRRLVEAGTTFVTLNTDSYSGQWDVHFNLKREMDKMLPVYDRMLTALIEDLTTRGLYQKVLVLVWGEFGRTPKFNANAGRDHWCNAGFALMFGGGLRAGTVVGSTNSRGEDAKDRPVSPNDVLATVYHVLGVNPKLSFPNRDGERIKVLNSGEPIAELL